MQQKLDPLDAEPHPRRSDGRCADNPFLERIVAHFASAADQTFCEFVRGAGMDPIRWCDLEGSARSFVAAYRGAGVPEGGLILIFLRHVPELYGSFVGAMLGGFVPSFMPCASPKQDPGIYWRSHAALFARVRPAAVVADRATLADMAANGLELGATRAVAIEDVTPAEAEWHIPEFDATALLQHSSGTTGLKKGVALSYRAILSQLDSYGTAIALSPDDVIVSWLPLYHDMGFVACFLMPLYARVSIVHLDPFEWAAQPGRLFDHITRRRGTLTWLPNFAFEHLATMAEREAERYDLSSMRAFINCSETCKPASFDRFCRIFSASGVLPEQLQCCYAMAETVFAVTQTSLNIAPKRLTVDRDRLQRERRAVPSGNNADGQQLIAVGQPITGMKVAIFDKQRRPLSEGMVGEIGVCGDFLFSGYNADPDRTRERLCDGTYFTRDLGFVVDGAVFVLGRIDDLIIVSGRNVYAHEIEHLLQTIDGIKPGRSAALPWFDDRAGTYGLVVVAERSAPAIRAVAEIRTEILSRVYSVVGVMPRAVHVVDEGWLVKTTSGKISREMNLRKLAESRPATIG